MNNHWTQDDEIIRNESEEAVFNTYKRYPLVLEEGSGSRVRDINGKEYIDVLAGIAVNNIGHCHPAIVEAVQKQVARLIHVSNFYYTRPLHQLARRLTSVAELDKVFLSNSGAEAVEAAVKLARKHGDSKGKSGNIIAIKNCFHGRTIGTIALGKEKYRKGYGPMPDRIDRVPFNDGEALRESVDDQTVAVFIEPVQGEGGVLPADPEYLRLARDLCDKNDALLVFDEVQCGIGRTGEMFAWMHSGVKPDILASAKGLGGGFPIGATLAKREVAALMGHGSHGTTFGGNPIACVAAMAVLDVIEQENLCEEALRKGKWFMEEVRRRTDGWESVKEVRGVGLMIGVELAFKAGGVVETMMENGVLSNVASESVIRVVPPLNIDQQDLEKVLQVMLESIREHESKAQV